MTKGKTTPKETRGRFNRILAASIGGLGDTVLFSPLLKALRRLYPEAHIELLVANRPAREIYSCAKEVSHVTFVNCSHSSSILKTLSLMPFIFNSRLNGRFDIACFATGLNPKLGLFLKNSGIVRDTIFAPAPPYCSTDLECNMALARRFDESICEEDVFIPISEKYRLEARMILDAYNISWNEENLLAVYPSVDLKHRPRWELSKIMQVIKLIRKEGFKGKIVVVGSQKEGMEWDELDTGKIVDANLAGKLSILGSASLLSKCSLTIGNDGGLMHVAGAVDSPSVTIMANTPLSYRPPGKRVKIIRSKLSCCDGLYPNRPKNCKIAKCTDDIKIKEVFRLCRDMLSTNKLSK